MDNIIQVNNERATYCRSYFCMLRLPQKPQYSLMLQRRKCSLPGFEMEFLQPRMEFRVEHNPAAQLRDRAPWRRLRKIGLRQFAKINCSHTCANIRFTFDSALVCRDKKLPVGSFAFTYG